MTSSPYLNRLVCKKKPMRGVSMLYHSNYLILVAVSICLIVFGTHQITNAQQQQPNANLTSTEQQQLLDGISFQIDNVTFAHHMATVNGIQLHYVMGGKGDPAMRMML